MVKNKITNDFNDNKLLNVKSIELNDEPINDTDAVNKLYVDNKTDNFSQTFDNSRNEHVLTSKGHIDMNNFNIENVRFMCIKYEPQVDCHPVILSYFNKHLDESTILRLNDDSNERYLQIRQGNTAYNLQIYNKAQIIDTTIIQNGNTGGYVLQHWLIECLDKKDSGKISNFIKTTRTSSPTGDSGSTTLPPIGNSFMYIETSSNNNGDDRIFCSWERTDLIHISNITFYYNRFTTSVESSRRMGRFRIQILKNNAWETIYTIEKNTELTELSTDWVLLNLDITDDNYGIKLIYDQIESAHADMCFSNIMITHSIF